MSTRSRGNEAEHRLQEMLSGLNWTVHRAVQSGFRVTPKGRRGKSFWLSRTNDVFGEFDLLATRLGSKVKYIQVTHGARAEKRESAALIPLDLAHNDIEVWEWRPGRRRKKKVGSGQTLAQVWVRHVLQMQDDLRVWATPVVVDPLVHIPPDISDPGPRGRIGKKPARQVTPPSTLRTEQPELLAAA